MNTLYDNITLASGKTLHLETETETAERIAEFLKEAAEDYRAKPTPPNKLALTYATADEKNYSGDLHGAIDYLIQELSTVKKPSHPSPEYYLAWMSANSLLVELLLRDGKPAEALPIAERIVDVAESHFSGTIEVLYAQEVYACCLIACEMETEAMEVFKSILPYLEEEISEATALKEAIVLNMKEIE